MPVEMTGRCRYQPVIATEWWTPPPSISFNPPLQRLPHLSCSSLSLSNISFCLVFCFSWWTFPFYFSFLFGQYFILFGGFLSNHSPLSLFLRMIQIVMMTDCHDVGKSYDNSLYGAHWFNHHRQKLALLKAKMHRVNTFGAIRQSLKGWWEEDTLGHASTFSFCTVTFHFSMTQNMREGSFRMIKHWYYAQPCPYAWMDMDMAPDSLTIYGYGRGWQRCCQYVSTKVLRHTSPTPFQHRKNKVSQKAVLNTFMVSTRDWLYSLLINLPITFTINQLVI